MRDMEIEEEVDWKKRREEILERLEKEEKDRLEKIDKAKRLEKSWEMSRECRKIIQENTNKWMTMEERKEKMNKDERFKTIATKKRGIQEQKTKNDKLRRIDEMYAAIPKTEEQRIKEEIKREENLELSEMKKNLWKKWRGKSKVLEKRTEIPTEIDKIQEKMRKIEEMR